MEKEKYSSELKWLLKGKKVPVIEEYKNLGAVFDSSLHFKRQVLYDCTLCNLFESMNLRIKTFM